MKGKKSLGRVAKRMFVRPNYLGLLGGSFLFCASITPSLLPRPWLLQGFISGISFAIGYGLGVLASWIARNWLRLEVPVGFKRYLRPITLALCVLIVVGFTTQFLDWQNEVRSLVGEQQLDSGHRILILLLAVVVGLVLVLVGRLIYWLTGRIDRVLARWIPRRLAGVAAFVVVVALLYLLFNGVLLKMFVNTSNNIYHGTNQTTPPGAKQPTSSLRSGSVNSLISWDSLGKQGRRFTGTGPTASQLQQFSGQTPAEPIRIYSGIDNADTIKKRAELAVKDLERAGGFDRPILVVVVPTGTGWVNPQTIDSLEYMWNGNTAAIAVQYSYLPSWISFIVDKQNATDAGRELFSQVYAKWVHLPKDHRPKLIAYGLSLGAYGIQAAFSGQEDLTARTSGALFVGTPNNTPLWRDIERNRDPGSPTWQPRYKNGKVIRFADKDTDLLPENQWADRRVVYLQHASDPVAWWSFNLILRRPDWLNEPRGRDVSGNVRWYPFSTFLHVTVDEFFGASANDGHGHNYSTAPVGAWAAVTQPENWTAQKTGQLQKLISTYLDK